MCFKVCFIFYFCGKQNTLFLICQIFIFTYETRTNKTPLQFILQHAKTKKPFPYTHRTA